MRDVIRIEVWRLLSVALTLSVVVTACRDKKDGRGATEPAAYVYGRVLDAEGSEALSGATVFGRKVGEKKDSVSVDVDEQGRFKLGLSSAGTWILTARAEGYTYVQRKVTVADGELASVRTMQLTPVDPKAIVVGPDGGGGANSDGSIELTVPAGALTHSLEIHATNFAHGWNLPGDLPSLSHFTYACALTPDGQEFDKPVTVRMRNTRGFPPGTKIPVGVYDPQTMTWAHESMGEISQDGQWAVFDVEHFSARDCNLGRTSPDGADSPGAVTDQTGGRRSKRSNKPCSAVHAGSLVGVADGHLSVGHRLPSVFVGGYDEALSLQYNSATLSYHQLLWVTYDITKTATELPDRIRFVVEVGGNRVEKFYDPVEGEMAFSYLWDGRDPMGESLPNGVYHYKLTLANEYVTTFAEVDEFGGEAVSDTGVEADELLSLESSFEGDLTLHLPDSGSSPLGFGWGIEDFYRLEQGADGTVWIRSGSGSAYGFARNEDGTLSPLPGDTSKLEEQSEGWLWTWADGTELTFATGGLLDRISDWVGVRRSYRYDEAARLVAVVHSDGRETTLDYDDAGRLAKITDPAGRSTEFSVDEAGDLVRITNPDGTSRVFVYEDHHRLVSQTDAAGNTTNYAYDDRGSIVRVDRPDGSHTEHGTLLSLGLEGPTDAALFYRDGSGGRYAFEVDPFGTRTLIRDPLGRTVRMKRDADDRLTRITRVGDSEGQDWNTGFAYDAWGRMTAVSGPENDGDATGWGALAISYDDRGRMVRLEDAVYGTHVIEYQGNSQTPSRITMPGGRVVSFEYDEQGLRTAVDVAGMRVAYNRDEAGLVSEIVDPSGASWTFDHDPYGNVTSVTSQDGIVQTFERDEMGRVLRESRGQETFDYEYAPAQGSTWGGAPASLVRSVTDGGGGTTSFEYDSRNRLAAIIDPLSHRTELTYDGEGRLVSRTLPTGDVERFEYNEAGQITRWVRGPGDECTYGYADVSGLLISADCGDNSLSFEYDRAFRISAFDLSFPDGLVSHVEYSYRQASLWEFSVSIHDADSGYWYEPTVEYDPNEPLLPRYVYGGISAMTLDYDSHGFAVGWEDSGGWLTAVIQRDGMGRVTMQEVTDSQDQTLLHLEASYGVSGLVDSLTGPEGVHAFSYDSAGRLLSLSHPSPDNPDEVFAYDASGNRMIAGSESEYRFDEAHRLLQDPEYLYEYDASGNRIARTSRQDSTVTTYTYDWHGQLRRVELPSGQVVEYGYDALGHRVEKRIDGVLVRRFLWHLDDVIAEFDGAGRLVKVYAATYAPDGHVGMSAWDDQGYGTDYYFVKGPDGTILALFDDSENLVATYRYRAFGEPVGLGPDPLNQRLFAGMHYDVTTGLYYARNRWYDPHVGLFIQRDPLPIGQARHPYAYVENRPWSTTDPMGLFGKHGPSGTQFFRDQAVKPGVEKGITSAVSRIPVVGGAAAGVLGVYFQFKDLIGIALADDPLAAARKWYKDQWWNPAGQYLDDFTSIGGVGSEKGGRGPSRAGRGQRRPGCSRMLFDEGPFGPPRYER